MKHEIMTSLEVATCEDDIVNIDLNTIPDEALFQGGIHDQVDIGVLDDIPYIISDVSNNSNNSFPLGPRGPPPRKDDPGQYNFSVEIHSKDTHKKKFLFSHKLNRIYVNMETDFAVQFNWELVDLAVTQMYVRATVVFEDESQAEKRVERCIQHKLCSSDKGQDRVVSENVLRSSRPLGTNDVQYCGHPDDPDYWYSVLVQLPKPGREPCTHAFKFVCKNSCSTGINRRSIAIIFTLESASGSVLGRQTVGARVCSCTARDMCKDEEAEGARAARKRPRPAQSRLLKKIKLETVGDLPVDAETLTLPPLEIIGAKTVKTGLEVMLRMMEQAAHFHKHDQLAADGYQRRVASLRQYIDTLDAKPTKHASE
ncbi:cellular tumor antigen p53 [Bombyx mandarina]|uniref:Cellular tumor antigen p53 n=1 Tax=Bombyx mandarina TaxID=7092 RepID=A0A6J2JBM3_BOMMA|nr:cellular tumor antigen p53 [Bombyx mandarina]XP_028026899.1 cellular tumor antigen p53 [Bombyx mandarina]XP_028026900.1 cellular tumor antigen p53 [Bombyx mandarina]